MSMQLIQQPEATFRLGDFLKDSLESADWKEFRAAIAFVKYSGTKHIRRTLAAFSKRGRVRISIGIDSGGTSVEGISDLFDAIEPDGELWVFHNAETSTFHPKVYLFKNDDKADLVVGSGNLTEGGLFTNYEASIRVQLDLSRASDRAVLVEVEAMLDAWSAGKEGLCYRTSREFIEHLSAKEGVPTEAYARETEEGRRQRVAALSSAESIFKRTRVPAAPPVVTTEETDLTEREAEIGEEIGIEVPEPAEAQGGRYDVFYMTLQKTDVGKGQTTTGTQQRSPEIFIPLGARDHDPGFWGWPDKFAPDPLWTGPIDKNGRGKMDRVGVKIRIGGETITATIWYNPDKKDVRIRSESLRSAGHIGDILRIERANGSGGFSYYVEVIPTGTIQYLSALGLCTETVKPPSKKRWGYT